MTKKLPPRLILLIVSITLATSFQYGYHSGVINQPLEFIEDFIGNISIYRYGVGDEGYKTTLGSICVTSFVVGGLVGALVSGFFARKLGRKKSILYLTIPCLIGSFMLMICKAANSFELIIVGRFLIGFSCGVYTAIAPIYLSEATPASARGMSGSLNQVVIVFSVSVSQILGLPVIMNTETLWPYLLGLNAIPSLVGAICLFFCPESPRYLFLVKEDTEGATRALELLRNSSDGIQQELDEFAKEADTVTEKASLLDILKQSHLRLALLVALAAHCGQQLSGVNGLVFYSVELFKSAGLSTSDANYATVGLGLVLFAITVVSIFVVDRVGRRPLLLGALSVVLSCLVLFTVFMIIREQTGAQWPVYVAITSIYAFICGFSMGAGSIPWFLVVEMFTQEKRDAAAAIGVTVNWICVITIGLGFIQLVNYASVYAFLPFVCVEIIAIAILGKFLPETMGRSPASVEDEFRHMLKKGSSYSEFGSPLVMKQNLGGSDLYRGDEVAFKPEKRSDY